MPHWKTHRLIFGQKIPVSAPILGTGISTSIASFRMGLDYVYISRKAILENDETISIAFLCIDSVVGFN